MLFQLYQRLNSDQLRQLALTALRVTTGFLLIWWGLNKIVSTGLSKTISDTFYGGAFSQAGLLIAFGVLQTAIGGLVVLGLWRRLAYVAQLVINGFTAVAVWYAILDPFGWYITFDRGFAFTQLFYPSAIILAASFLLIAFHDQDRWVLDRALRPSD